MGIDKTADVLDSTLERDQITHLYLTSLLNPSIFEQESSDWLNNIKNKLNEYKSTEGTLPTLASKDIKVEKVDSIKHSPLPKWLEGLTKAYLKTKGIAYHNLLEGIQYKFPGLKENIYTFNIKESVNNPIPEPISLQHEIIQSILKEAIPFTESQQIPTVKIKQSNSTFGQWSLWHLEVKNQFGTNQIIQPLFITTKGDSFTPYAQSVWDKLIQENDYIDCLGALSEVESRRIFDDISNRVEVLLQSKYEEFEKNLIKDTEKIRANKVKSFAFQEKQLNRIGIENIKQSRLNRLYKEKEIWETSFGSSSQIVPSLSCLLMLNIVDG